MSSWTASLLAAGLTLTAAVHATPDNALAARVAPPQITRAPARRDAAPAVQERGLISDLRSGLSSLEQATNTDGLFFPAFPTGSQVASSLGADPTGLAAKPTEVLNIPPYANWSGGRWNVRFHGNVYKLPDISDRRLDDLTNIFLPGVSVNQLPPDQAAQARNLTREIYIVQQKDARPTFNLAPAPSAGSDGSPGGGGASTPAGGSQTVVFPYNTTVEGDFDTFVPIDLNGLDAGDRTAQIQRLNVHTLGTDTGNATAYLVPPGPGLTVISDIDDILRVTKIYEPKEGLLNSFARPFVPWLNMPEIYANWSQHLSLGNNATHFHYLTTTPEQVTRNYMQFIYATYPGGSFDTRPLNFSNPRETLSVREFLLEKIFATFPQRKFILVADTSNPDIMRDYPSLAHKYPAQVQCIFLRNTTATDAGDRFPYDTAGFRGLAQDKYMFFVVPDDLKGLDIANGRCYNASVRQNVTYGLQGLPFGINLGNGNNGSSSSSSSSSGGAASTSSAGGSGNGSSEAVLAVGEVQRASAVALIGAFVAAWWLL